MNGKLPKETFHLYMQACIALAMDSQVDVKGNSHDAWSVVQTIEQIATWAEDDAYSRPTREDMVFYLKVNGREDEIEYLMEE